jgi:hypothetical protein
MSHDTDYHDVYVVVSQHTNGWAVGEYDSHTAASQSLCELTADERAAVHITHVLHPGSRAFCAACAQSCPKPTQGAS